MLIGIDHGNKQIKSRTRIFTSGLCESDTRPPFRENILFYSGKYYTLSDERIPYMRDKTKTNGPLFSHCLPLPLNLKMQGIRQRRSSTYSSESASSAHYGTQYEKFEKYFLGRGILYFRMDGDPMPCLSVRPSDSAGLRQNGLQEQR